MRIVIAKVGLDGHDRGAKVIARALAEAGFEVIYTGLFRTPESAVRTVVEEDADALGISILSGAHMTVFPSVADELRKQDLLDIGVERIFGPGTDTEKVVAFLKEKEKAKK